jgi:hypothetical protein
VTPHDTAVVDRYLRAVQAGDALPKGRFHELELQFVSSARSFSIRNGISFGAWRDVGVDLDVLTRAGLADADLPNSEFPNTGRRCARSPRATTRGQRGATPRAHPMAGCGDDR